MLFAILFAFLLVLCLIFIRYFCPPEYTVMHHLVTSTLHKAPNKKIDVVVGLDARGFLLGPIIALRLGAAFVPVRKAGKLPGACEKVEYEKEYGSDFFEVRLRLLLAPRSFS